MGEQTFCAKLRKNSNQGIEVKVGHYLLFMLTPSEIKQDHSRNKKYLFTIFTVFCIKQHSNKQTICFDFDKQIIASSNLAAITIYILLYICRVYSN